MGCSIQKRKCEDGIFWGGDLKWLIQLKRLTHKGGKVEERNFCIYSGIYVRTIFIIVSFAPLFCNLIAGLLNHPGDPDMGSLLEVSSSLCDCAERRPPEPHKSLPFSTTSFTFSLAPGSVMKLEEMFPANYLRQEQKNCWL